ncbi:MAG: DUF4862 family protein [Alphaproteobacteria bacterium]|nr:DUF4862 family protein [Alphaproteobacteria bacterium]
MATIVGAYATSPASTAWNEAAETAYYDGLKAMPSVRGLEVPLTGALHPHDEAWLLRALKKDWDFVVTCIPGTMQTLVKDKTFGLASDDAAGRRAAVAFASKARDAVGRINAAVGRKAVIAVEVQSGPTQGGGGKGSAGAFTESLAEIAGWDWQGARIVIEHCDAYRAGHPPIKGFLTLDDELKAIAGANKSARKPIGVSINWGRSVLETYKAETAVDHIKQARDAGALSGLMFSGASGAQTPYGAWQDAHMPHAPAPGIAHAAEGSLLTEPEIKASLAAAGKGLDFIGAKIGIRPPDASVATRLGTIADLIKLIERNAT